MVSSITAGDECCVLIISSHLITLAHALVEVSNLESIRTYARLRIIVITNQEQLLIRQQKLFPSFLNFHFSRMGNCSEIIHDIISWHNLKALKKLGVKVDYLMSTRLDHKVTLTVYSCLREARLLSVGFTFIETGESLGVPCHLYSKRASIKRKLVLGQLSLYAKRLKRYSLGPGISRIPVLKQVNDLILVYFDYMVESDSPLILNGSYEDVSCEVSPSVVVLLPYLKLNRSPKHLTCHDPIDLSHLSPEIDYKRYLSKQSIFLLTRLFNFLASKRDVHSAGSVRILFQLHPKNSTDYTMLLPMFQSFADNYCTPNLFYHCIILDSLCSEYLAYKFTKSACSVSFYGFGTNLLPFKLILGGLNASCEIVPLLNDDFNRESPISFPSSEIHRYHHVSSLLSFSLHEN
jgi:hypothetical protein